MPRTLNDILSEVQKLHADIKKILFHADYENFKNPSN